MMTEPTNTTNDGTFFDERSESEKSIAADIAMVVESAVTEKAPQNAVVIQPKPIIASEYVDPIDEQYKLARKNHIGGIENRESPEGIASLHAFFSLAGDMAEY